MYVIENEAHEQQGKVLNNLRVITRPDGGMSSNVKVDEQVHDENGNVYFIREVIHTVEGEGPRVISHAAPAWDGEKWTKVKTVGAALPPPQDPVPGDENYRYEELRKRDYGDYGDQLDMMYHDLLDGTSTWKDHISEVKNAFPKPVEEVDAEVVEVDAEVVEVDAEVVEVDTETE